MWGLFRRKKEPARAFYIRFQVTYKLLTGKFRKTDPIYVIIHASSKEEAERVLKFVAASRIEVEMLDCVEK